MVEELQQNYLTAQAVKVGDNQIVLWCNGRFEIKKKVLAVLSMEEFRAVYRMIFTMIELELDKPIE